MIDSLPPFKPLLFINEYPPSSVAGAPVIARQLLREYDMDKLHVLACKHWPDTNAQATKDTYLPCDHTFIPSAKRTSWRPRRVFIPIESTLDSFRINRIMAEGRRLIQKHGIKALFTMTYGAEFPLAAYFLSKETGLPLYYFETDHWPTHASPGRAKMLVNKHYDDFLNHVTQLWLTSPAMVRSVKEKHGVDGDFLFHFIDLEAYQSAARMAPPLPEDLIIFVYTGSINDMFYDTMKRFCDLLNGGLMVAGRPVEMRIYSGKEPDAALLGKRVTWAGFVPLEQIPAELAKAHFAAILVSFSDKPDITTMVRTSLYTKTIDYLASGRPTIVVSPPYAAEVDYFGGVTCVVSTPGNAELVDAITCLATDPAYCDDLRQKGLELVKKRHTMEALQDIFLSYFREQPATATPAVVGASH